MIATLPMYDRLELYGAHDRFWQLIREELGDGPPRLDRYASTWAAWRSPDLVLSQTCSLPYRIALHGHVGLVGVPDLALPNCPPGTYNSVLVARGDDDRSLGALLRARIAVNDRRSQSGYATVMGLAQSMAIVPDIASETGSHRGSIAAVAEGRADIAAIDAQTWRLATFYDANARTLREVHRTEPTHGLPYICSRFRDPAPVLAAMRRALQRLDPGLRQMLWLRDIVPANAQAMLALPVPTAPDTV